MLALGYHRAETRIAQHAPFHDAPLLVPSTGYPYSPKCVEEEFSEVRLLELLRRSAATRLILPARSTDWLLADNA